ncbi:MAG: hypothetical protein Q9209_003086 [Squamulea sp. 1 TL-2023]
MSRQRMKGLLSKLVSNLQLVLDEQLLTPTSTPDIQNPVDRSLVDPYSPIHIPPPALPVSKIRRSRKSRRSPQHHAWPLPKYPAECLGHKDGGDWTRDAGWDEWPIWHNSGWVWQTLQCAEYFPNTGSGWFEGGVMGTDNWVGGGAAYDSVMEEAWKDGWNGMKDPGSPESVGSMYSNDEEKVDDGYSDDLSEEERKRLRGPNPKDVVWKVVDGEAGDRRPEEEDTRVWKTGELGTGEPMDDGGGDG